MAQGKVDGVHVCCRLLITVGIRIPSVVLLSAMQSAHATSVQSPDVWVTDPDLNTNPNFNAASANHDSTGITDAGVKTPLSPRI